ncbi:MAG: hypothetical protein WB791_07675 [Waddliaceae bacterium]
MVCTLSQDYLGAYDQFENELQSLSLCERQKNWNFRMKAKITASVVLPILVGMAAGAGIGTLAFGPPGTLPGMGVGGGVGLLLAGASTHCVVKFSLSSPKDWKLGPLADKILPILQDRIEDFPADQQRDAKDYERCQTDAEDFLGDLSFSENNDDKIVHQSDFKYTLEDQRDDSAQILAACLIQRICKQHFQELGLAAKEDRENCTKLRRIQKCLGLIYKKLADDGGIRTARLMMALSQQFDRGQLSCKDYNEYTKEVTDCIDSRTIDGKSPRRFKYLSKMARKSTNK